MRRRGGHVAEQRRPELADTHGGLAEVHVGVGEAQARGLLLVAEGAGAVEAAEEVELDEAGEVHVADGRALPVQRDARVADVAAPGPLVLAELRARELGVLAVAEREVRVLREQRGCHEALDRQGALVGRLDGRRRRRLLLDLHGDGWCLHLPDQLLELGNAGLELLFLCRLRHRSTRQGQCRRDGHCDCASLDPRIHGGTSPVGLCRENAPHVTGGSIGGWSKPGVARTQRPADGEHSFRGG